LGWLLKNNNKQMGCQDSWNCVYVSYNYTIHYGAQPNVRFEIMILNDMKVTIVLETIYNDCQTFSIKLLVGWTFD
jgi:hypothetical protein